MLLIAACHPPVARAQPVTIGMSVSLWDADDTEIAREFDLMSTMNVKLVRFDFDWSGIEKVQGKFDWDYTDRMVRAANARGMKILALLTYTPTWARPAGTSSHTPPSRAEDFATFAHAAAQRYSVQGVRHWEIWNEPNTSDFWQPMPSVEGYGSLFRATVTAIREVDPKAFVLTGGLTRGATAEDGSRIAQTDFVNGLYANGTAQMADAVALHPYSFPSLPSDGVATVVGSLADLPSVHAVMDHWGDGEKKIWITEFGAATGDGDGAMTEQGQAESILQAEQLVRSWGWGGPLIIYELRDHGTDRDDIEQNFGVVHNDLSPKEAAENLQNNR